MEDIKFLVLDEADELLTPNFKMQIEGILENSPKDKQVMLFSATMPPDIRSVTRRYGLVGGEGQRRCGLVGEGGVRAGIRRGAAMTLCHKEVWLSGRGRGQRTRAGIRECYHDALSQGGVV